MGKTLQHLSSSEKDTIHFGRKLASHLKPGDIVCLFGDLGSGKTTFVKGLAQGLKIKHTQVNSPTFILMNVYEGGSTGSPLSLYHFDLYRLQNPQEILAIGYEEFFYGDGVAVIEWADKLGPLLPKEYLSVVLTHQTPNKRLIKFEGVGKSCRELMENFDSGVRK